jgi:hypothetical protein
LNNTSGINTGDETATSLGSKINEANSKTTPVDADMIGLMDSAASNMLKKLSWANIKATLKTYFDTLYTLANLGGVPTSRTVNGKALSSDISLTATDIGVSTTNFDGNLSEADDTLQKALDTLDNMIASGSGGIVKASYTGLIDGINTEYILDKNYADIMLYLNGVLYTNTEYSYLAGTVTMNIPIATGTELLIFGITNIADGLPTPTQIGAIASNITGITGADAITNGVSLTTAEYGAITPDASTLYFITDAT